MNIFRAVAWARTRIGTGRRITLPAALAERARLREGDSVEIRLEESASGKTQIIIRKEEEDA